MKRFYKYGPVLLIVLLLFACGSDHKDEPVFTPEPVVTAAPTPEAEDELTLITPVPTPTPEPPTPTPVPTPTPTPSPTPTPEPTPEPEGLIGWTKGGFVPKEEQISNEEEYIGENVHITVKTVYDETTYPRRVTYYITDIYIRNIQCLRTAAAKTFHSYARSTVDEMAKREGAIAAISGDMFNAHKHQLVIRNGTVYDTKLYSNWELCFLYLDGTMETMTVDEFKPSTMRDDVWQAWEFGPSLLDADGHALEKFPTSNVKTQNPRCVIGYYEPGHYCFVTVDGRQQHSRGLEMHELAQLMESLGCKLAFNLDGGESASLYWNGKIFSKPSKGGRVMSDIVYIVDVPAEKKP